MQAIDTNGQSNNSLHRFYMDVKKQPIISKNMIESIILSNTPKISLNVRDHIINNLDKNHIVFKPLSIFNISDYNIIPSTPAIGHAFQVNYSISNYSFVSGEKIATVNAGIFLNGTLQGSIQTKKDISVPNDSTISGTFSFTLSQPGNGYKLKLSLKNQITFLGCCISHQECCKAADSAEIDFSVSQNFSLTGLWKANDGGTYYISQQGNQLWWAGLSDDGGLQNGLTFCNLFSGRISGEQIAGEWADVPRGLSMNFGQMSLKIVFDGAGNPVALEKQNSAPVGFGASHWDRQFIILPPYGGSLFNLMPLDNLLSQISKNTYYYDYGDATPELENLRRNLEPVKEPVVLYGTLVPGSTPNFPPFRNSFLPPKAPRDWAHFEHMELDNYKAEILNPASDDIPGIPQGQNDADIDFNIQVDTFNLPSDFFFGMSPDNVKKIHEGVQPEMVMFARPWSGPLGQMPTLLPGWAESNGNSVLINGRPLNGECTITDTKTVSSFFSGPTPIGGEIVRVSGPLVIDVGHNDRHLEIHPVYSIDFFKPTSSDDLSGVWGDDQNCTYYVHCINNTIWILIMKPLRDLSFAAVFKGEKLSAGTVIKGTWSSIPYGNAVGGGDMFFTINPNKISMLLTGDVPLAPSHLLKLYDEHH